MALQVQFEATVRWFFRVLRSSKLDHQRQQPPLRLTLNIDERYQVTLHPNVLGRSHTDEPNVNQGHRGECIGYQIVKNAYANQLGQGRPNVRLYR